MILADLRPTERFAGRQSDYSTARPGYPAEIIKFLEDHSKFSTETVVADVGSGTGKLTSLFLENGNEVFAIEPNADMRNEAQRLLGTYRSFHNVEGSAEATGLPDESVDLVSAGQAFHWFDHEKAKKEFSRILKPQSFVMLVWNTRKKKKGTFSHDYEELIERGRSRSLGWSSSEPQAEEILRFFRRAKFEVAKFENAQSFDFPRLLARLRSASYMPKDGVAYERLVKSARKTFARHESHGIVTMDYETEVYLGKLR